VGAYAVGWMTWEACLRIVSGVNVYGNTVAAETTAVADDDDPEVSDSEAPATGTSCLPRPSSSTNYVYNYYRNAAALAARWWLRPIWPEFVDLPEQVRRWS